MRTLKLMGAAALIWAAGTFAALAADLGEPSKSIFDASMHAADPARSCQPFQADRLAVHRDVGRGQRLAAVHAEIDRRAGLLSDGRTVVDVALGKGDLHQFADLFAGYSRQNTEFALTLGSDTFSRKRPVHAFDNQETGMAVCLTGDLRAGIAAPI